MSKSSSGAIPASPADLLPADEGAAAELTAHAKRPPLWGFLVAYWRSQDRWTAMGLLAAILVIIFGTTYLAVWANTLAGDVTDTLVNRQWEGLFTAMWTMLLVTGLSTLITLSSTALTGILELRWRTWLTDHLMDRWTQALTFYDIEREGLLKNADQRISEDVKLFTNQSLYIVLSTIQFVVEAVTFTVLLWGLSKSISFSLGGQQWEVQGYMVYIAFLYAGLGLLVTHWFGHQMMSLTMRQQGVEADFRYLGMQLRENAEQIAFYLGGERERVRLRERFSEVRLNTLQIIARTFKLSLARNTYSQVLQPLPTVAALPLYFAGQVSIGGLTQITGAFTALISSLSYFSQAYTGFMTWLAVTNRVRDLCVALDEAEQRHSGFEHRPATDEQLSSSTLQLQTPDGRVLTEVPPLTVKVGDRLMLRGPSGTGKSTLLRTLAGLWPHGQGTIAMPEKMRSMFLPQRSYIPSGSLKAAICFPWGPDAFDDASCLVALALAGLDAMSADLAKIDDWQHKLSGGEQQRLAFARVFLHKPDFVFLDEATSALDEHAQGELYGALIELSPACALVSVAHRSSLAQYHTSFVDLVPHATAR